MPKKQLGQRVNKEVYQMFEEVVKKIQDSMEIGTVTKDEVMELAIKDLYKKYIGA